MLGSVLYSKLPVCNERTVQDTGVQQRLISEIFTLVANRPASACNFLPYKPGLSIAYLQFCTNARIRLPPLLASSSPPSSVSSPGATHNDTPSLVTYRHYATLYFILISTSTESPLALLDLIQVFVEALDRLFENVCELDLIFNFETLHATLAEMIVGGVVIETSLETVVKEVKKGGKVPRRTEGGGMAAVGRLGVGRM